MYAKISECLVCGKDLTPLTATTYSCKNCRVIIELVEYEYKSALDGGDVSARWIIREGTG